MEVTCQNRRSVALKDRTGKASLLTMCKKQSRKAEPAENKADYKHSFHREKNQTIREAQYMSRSTLTDKTNKQRTIHHNITSNRLCKCRHLFFHKSKITRFKFLVNCQMFHWDKSPVLKKHSLRLLTMCTMLHGNSGNLKTCK